MGNLNRSKRSQRFEQQQKMNVEGPMFVVERKAEPKYRFVILSRKSTERYYEDITPELELQLQLPYVMYLHRASRIEEVDQIYGIWFYNNVQSINFVDLISRLSNSSPPPQLTNEQPNQKSNQNDQDGLAAHLKNVLGVNQQPQVDQHVAPLNPLEQFVREHNISFNTQPATSSSPIPFVTPDQSNQQASKDLLALLQQPLQTHVQSNPTSSSPPNVVQRVSPNLFLYQPSQQTNNNYNNETVKTSVKDLLTPQQFVENIEVITQILGDQDPTKQEFKEALLQIIRDDGEYVDNLYKMYMLARKFGKM
jgi:hypothetical protein